MATAAAAAGPALTASIGRLGALVDRRACFVNRARSADGTGVSTIWCRELLPAERIGARRRVRSRSAAAARAAQAGRARRRRRAFLMPVTLSKPLDGGM